MKTSKDVNLLFAKVKKKKELSRKLEEEIENYSGELFSFSEIEINEIIISSAQPRLIFDDKSIIKLAKSIDKYGLLEPIVVAKNKNNSYTLLAGERRIRAFAYLGRSKINAMVFDKKDGINKNLLEVISLIENIHREDLSSLELAAAYQNIQQMDDKKRTYAEIAEIVGKTEAHVKTIMPLNNLSPKVSLALRKSKNYGVDNKTLSLLASVREYKKQEEIFKIMLEKKLNRTAALKLIREYKSNGKSVLKKKKKYFEYEATSKTINVKIELNKIPKKYKKELEEIKIQLEALSHKISSEDSNIV